MRGRWLGVLVLVVAFGGQAAPAAADDASVWAAYTARDAEVDAVAAESRRAFRNFTKRPNTRTVNAVIRVSRKQEVMATEIGAAIAAQPSSTAAGERAKALLLKEADLTRRGWHLYVQCFTNTKRGRTKLALRQLRAANRRLDQSIGYGKRGVAAFKRLGIAPADY
jgi:hypothetical protein